MIQDTTHSVRDKAGRRWPAPDGIPFLRTGREALADAALAKLDAGDDEGALVLLLADQDAWWRGPTADPDALRALVRQRTSLTLREAMAMLSWGPVADYFAHRWSDPTFLAGLALMEAHWPSPRTAFELACGIGHHLRELALRGVAATGGDVVFAKLWVARHWVLPGHAAPVRLLCFDAAGPWPVDGPFDLVACHDAFYFLEPKPAIRDRLRTLRDPAAGVLTIGHVHNRDWPNMSAGSAVTAAELGAQFPEAVLYDDAELTRALAERRAPVEASAGSLTRAEAFSLAEGPRLDAANVVEGLLAMPARGTALRRNPLYGDDGRIAWPSERYAREYGPRATYPLDCTAPRHAVLDTATDVPARRRELVDLPERW